MQVRTDHLSSSGGPGARRCGPGGYEPGSFSVVSLKRFVEPRLSGDFAGGKLPHVLPVDLPLGSIGETRGKHAFASEHREATRGFYDRRGCRIDHSDSGVGFLNPLLVWLQQIHLVFRPFSYAFRTAKQTALHTKRYPVSRPKARVSAQHLLASQRELLPLRLQQR